MNFPSGGISGDEFFLRGAEFSGEEFFLRGGIIQEKFSYGGNFPR